MKRIIILSVFISLLTILNRTTVFADPAESRENSSGYADESEWVCPMCGSLATQNFCSNCGAEKPKTELSSDFFDKASDDSRTNSFLNSLSEQERSIRGFYRHEAEYENMSVSYVIEVEPIGHNKAVIIEWFYENLLGDIEQDMIGISNYNVVSLNEIILKDSELFLWEGLFYTKTTAFDFYSRIISDGLIRDFYLMHFEGSLIENAKYHLEYDLTDGFKYIFQGKEYTYPNAVALGHIIIEDPNDPNSLWWAITENAAAFGTKDGTIMLEDPLIDIPFCIHAGYYKFVDDGISFMTGDYIIEEEELAIFQEPTEWLLAYQEFVRNNMYIDEQGYYKIRWQEADDSESFFCQISLLYIDEDDIPEMVIGLYTGSCLVVSWKPTGLGVSINPHSIIGYIEKGNSFYFYYGGRYVFYQINNMGKVEISYTGGRVMKGLKFIGFDLNGSEVSKSECIDGLRDYYSIDKSRRRRSESYYGYETFLNGLNNAYSDYND